MSTNFQSIAPKTLQNYIQFLGWKESLKKTYEGLYVFANEKFERGRLIFPIEQSAPDYGDAVGLALEKIADLEKKSVAQVLAELNAMNEDTVGFRLIDAANEQQYIPFSYALEAMNGAKGMLLSAAHSVLQPQAHHPKMRRKEATDFLNATRFRHTEMGSFVLKVSCPLEAINKQGNLYDPSIPFVRQTALALNEGVAELVNAIERNKLKELIDGLKDVAQPKISSNLCYAVADFQTENKGFDLSLGFSWAASLRLPEGVKVKNSIDVKRDYFSQIVEIGTELKNTQSRKIDEIFLATVEKLSGEIGDDGKRSGEVTFKLYSVDNDDKSIRASANLDSAQYAVANQAHMKIGSVILIKGKLSGKNLAEITAFDLLTEK